MRAIGCFILCPVCKYKCVPSYVLEHTFNCFGIFWHARRHLIASSHLFSSTQIQNDTTSAVAKAAAIFGMFRESEEDGDAFLNFAEYSQFHRGVAELKKDGGGKGGDDVVLSKEAWTKLTDSIPECDPEVGLSLDAFIQLKTIQQNMDLNKSY